MYSVRFKEAYSKRGRKINHRSPEILFLQSICDNKNTVEDFFNDATIYCEKVFLDAPNGHFEGVEGIKCFAQNWLKDFGATSGEVHPVIQTTANGRSVTEMEIWFFSGEKCISKVPMVVFADLIAPNRMEGMRIYYFYKFLEGSVAYRKPIFRPRFNTWCEPWLLTDVVRYYYEQLHNFRTEEAIENIVNMCSDDVHYGGYRPEEEEPLFEGKVALRKVYEGICRQCPGKTYVRFETIVDDGINCAVEWTTIVRQSALAGGDVSFAGCAVYERDADGKLWSIRICDNAGYDHGIDLNSIPEHDWFID